jgi:predicted nuclease of predicted toxin-antitoxin system
MASNTTLCPRADSMFFLVDADLPQSVVQQLHSSGHEAIAAVDLGIIADADIASYAREHGMCILTGDFDFADVRNYPPREHARIIVLTLPRTANAAFIRQLVGQLLGEPTLADAAGALYVIEPGRVRIRR